MMANYPEENVVRSVQTDPTFPHVYRNHNTIVANQRLSSLTFIRQEALCTLYTQRK